MFSQGYVASNGYVLDRLIIKREMSDFRGCVFNFLINFMCEISKGNRIRTCWYRQVRNDIDRVSRRKLVKNESR